jgi:hypothetical protein
MREILDIDDKTAKKLRELADADGVSIEQLLAAHIPGLKAGNGNGLDASKALSAFEEWVESFSQEAPPLSDNAISRASIYRDR